MNKFSINYALSNTDITNIMKNKVNVFLYKNIHKVNSINELLYPYDCCVILFETYNGYGHWCALLKTNQNNIEFFNSYGGFPDDSLKMINRKFRILSNQLIPKLSELMIDSPYELNYNEFDFQKHNENVKTCGRHCCVRLINKHLDIYKYKELLDSYNIDYDVLVTKITNKLLT